MSTTFNPQVQELMKPIIYDSTILYVSEKSNPMFSNYVDDATRKKAKAIKQNCVHYVFENNEYVTKVHREGDSLVCEACGHEICAKFDGSNVKALTDAIPVLDQLIYFGVPLNLSPDIVKTILSCKQILPALAQVVSGLNEYVRRDTSAMDAVRNIGSEYDTSALRGITGMR